MNKIVIAGISLLLMGCATPQVTILNQDYIPKGKSDKIDVFKSNRPQREYVELAEIVYTTGNQNENIQNAINKAKNIGADGIIITGSAGQKASQDFWGRVSLKDYGLKAIVIKFKEVNQ